ncbi:MAG: endonuclease [Planctomycetota bacterium]|nr:MAG: endonuclease [Planctomycetota bacterium]
MFPIRLSLATYNLWNTERWPEREPALQFFTDRYKPDILCLQELRSETRTMLDQALPNHDRVNDDFPGWICEGNIYWRSDLFSCIEYGAEDIGILSDYRRLFWIRLKQNDGDKVFFVSTAHYTYQCHPKERETGNSPRLEETRETVTALRRLVTDDEPVFFMGDLNDSIHPLRILYDAGYKNCFSELGVVSPPTFPSMPTAGPVTGIPRITATIDWLFANEKARPIAAQVPHCYHENLTPSDHWPVLAVYEI